MRKYIAVCIILLSLFEPVSAATPRPVNVYLKDTKITVPGMESVRFAAVSGTDRILNYTLYVTTANREDMPIYSLEDPFSVRRTPRGTAIPSHLPTDRVKAVLAMSGKHSPKQAGTYTGVELSSDEYTAATQLAIWLAIQDMSQVYKVDEGSVRSDKIRTTARWLVKSADDAILRKPQDVDAGAHVWPLPSLTVNSDSAKGGVQGQFNYYGPYTIESPDRTLSVNHSSEGSNYAIVNTVGGSVIESVKVEEPFYVRFGRNIASDVSITFSAETTTPDIRLHDTHVYLWKRIGTTTCILNIGNKNSAGKIRFVKFDSLTEAGIKGTKVEVRDAKGNLAATMTTNESGEALSPELRVGSYIVREVSPGEGYFLDNTEYPAEIKGNGEVALITSRGMSDMAYVSFVCMDENTNAPVGGSIFEVINSENQVVTRIGFKSSGRCSNIKLPPGPYWLKETVTNMAYEYVINRIEFEAVSGKQQEVMIRKTPVFSYTRFFVKNDDGEIAADAELEFYLSDGTLFTELKTDAQGELSIGLPAGTYFVRTKKTYTAPASESHKFLVQPVSDDTIIEIEIKNYTAYIFGEVRDTQGGLLAGVGVAAVDDKGVEYSSAATNFEGQYRLPYLPDRAVVYVKVYKAPYGFSGEFADDRVILLEEENRKDLVLYSMEEYNADLPEEERVVSFDFYKLKSGDNDEPVDSTPQVRAVQPKPTPASSEQLVVDTGEIGDNGMIPIAIAVLVLVGGIILFSVLKSNKSGAEGGKAKGGRE